MDDFPHEDFLADEPLDPEVDEEADAIAELRENLVNTADTLDWLAEVVHTNLESKFPRLRQIGGKPISGKLANLASWLRAHADDDATPADMVKAGEDVADTLGIIRGDADWMGETGTGIEPSAELREIKRDLYRDMADFRDRFPTLFPDPDLSHSVPVSNSSGTHL